MLRKGLFILILIATSVPSWAQSSTASSSSSTPTDAAVVANRPSKASLSSPTDNDRQKQSTAIVAGKSDVPGIDPMTGLPIYKSIHEDWKSLSVKGSELVPQKPLIGEVDEQPKFTRTLVALKWRPGDPLDVYVIMPKGVTKPPAVLYLYSYTEDTDRFKSDAWCERATAQGVAAVGFVSALSGHRFHDRPMKQWFVSELQESLGSTVHDVKFILDYLDSRGDIDMNRIGMFGQGSGGTIAILAAAADPRIKAIDVLEPWGDWPNWLAKSSVVQEDPEKDRYTRKDFLKEVAPLDPVKWLPKLKSTAIRIQQITTYDDSVPEISQNRIKSAAPKQAEIDRWDNTVRMANVEGGGRMWDWMRNELAKMKTAQSAAKNAIAERAPARDAAAQN